MRFSFTAISKIILEHEPGAKTSTLAESNLRLEVGKTIDKSMYIDLKDLPKEPGIKPLTQALIHGIMSNIKMADKKGWWKEADHLRYVLDELTRAFAHVTYSDPQISEGAIDNNV